MSMSFDYQGARKAGYSDEEIAAYLAEKNPKFNFKGAREAGYTDQEINDYLSKAPGKKEDVQKSSALEKGVDKAQRLLTQGTIGAIQRYTAGYDIPSIVTRKIAIANAPSELRQSIFSDIENLQERKAAGEWSDAHQQEYDALVDLIKDPKKMEQFLPKEEEVPHFDVGSLIEKGAKNFGVDLTPQGADEMALRWIGFIKDPSKASQLLKEGLNPKNAKEILKALAPTGKEALRGASAGTALQYAAEAELGPIGTMAAAILGDVAPSLALKSATGAANVAKNIPGSAKEGVKAIKKGAAKAISSFTPKDKQQFQRSIIQDFKDAGIQADAGTISGNSLVKWVQSTLDQSALTGSPFEKFKKSLTDSIVSEYGSLANELGESVHQSRYEAGEALKSALKEARDLDISSARELYNSAKESAQEAQVYTGNVGSLIKELENELQPGSFKSSDQKAVLDIINQVKQDVLTKDGTIKSAKIKELINDKIALNDAIDYEIQGGTKKLLQSLVGEIEKAIQSHGDVNPQFAKDWKEANAKFSQHAKLFRGKTISNALKTQDPSLVFSKMNTPHGIEEIRKALNVYPEGRQIFNQLARYKLEEMIGKNMINSTTNQVNFGTFSKLLEKNQNRQVVKSLLGENSLKRLERLQKASGRLAETGQKFLNSSRSGVHALDLAAAGKVMMDTANIFAGNPWPLLKSGGTLFSTRSIARLLTDPEFLQLLEEAMMESKRGFKGSLENAGIRLAKKIKSLEEPATAAIQTTSRN